MIALEAPPRLLNIGAFSHVSVGFLDRATVGTPVPERPGQLAISHHDGRLGRWSDDLHFARRITVGPRPAAGVLSDAFDAAVDWWMGPDPDRLRRRPAVTVLGHRDPNLSIPTCPTTCGTAEESGSSTSKPPPSPIQPTNSPSWLNASHGAIPKSATCVNGSPSTRIGCSRQGGCGRCSGCYCPADRRQNAIHPVPPNVKHTDHWSCSSDDHDGNRTFLRPPTVDHDVVDRRRARPGSRHIGGRQFGVNSWTRTALDSHIRWSEGFRKWNPAAKIGHPVV